MSWTKLIKVILLSAGIVGIASAQPATSTSDGAATNIAGRWNGECNRCAARSFALVLAHDGAAVTGTIKTEGTPTFGDSVKPIINVRLSANKLFFEAKGDAGDLFYVELTAGSDGKALNGTGWYRNSSFGLSFNRATQ